MHVTIAMARRFANKIGVFIRDDRGTPVPLLGGNEIQWTGWIGKVIRRRWRVSDDHDRAKQVAESAIDRSWRRQLSRSEVVSTLLIACGPFVMVLVLKPSGFTFSSIWLPLVVGLTLGLVSANIGERITLRVQSGRVRDALIREGRCASCGYVVQEVDQELDGCVVCPECAAAWRLQSDV